MSHEVTLHVYDLSQGAARAMSMQFLGIQLDIVPHTGIVVYGKEYFYSGGLQSEPAAAFAQMYHTPVHSTVSLGTTEVPEELFSEFLAERRAAFTMSKYSLLRHNCNHFTEECAQFLLGVSIPQEIRDVPERVLATPMGPLFSSMFEGVASSFDPLRAPRAPAAPPPPPTFDPSAVAQLLATPTPAARPAGTPAATSPADDRTAAAAAAEWRASALRPAAPTPRASTRQPVETPARREAAPPPTPPLTTPAHHPTHAVHPAVTPATRIATKSHHAPNTASVSRGDGDGGRGGGGGGDGGDGGGGGSGDGGDGGGGGGGDATPRAAPSLATPATSAATKLLHASGGAIGGKVAMGRSNGRSLTPIVTPAPATPIHERRFYPCRQPLSSANGPYQGVLQLVNSELSKPAAAAALPPGRSAADFLAALRTALSDPVLLTASSATSLASTITTLLRAWPPTSGQLHFAMLYMARLIAASSDAYSSAVLEAGLPSVLLDLDTGAIGGVLDSAAAPRKAARGARLMALALIANIAMRKPDVATLLSDSTRAAAVVGAACRALGAHDDPAVGQMGGALAHNLTVAMSPQAASEHMPPLLTAALTALRALADATSVDAEYLARALNVVGQLLSVSQGTGAGAGTADTAEAGEEALAVALSLDGAAVLDLVRDKAAGAGHASLVDRVRALLG